MKKELVFILGAAVLGTVCFSNLTADKVSAKTSGDYKYVVTGKKKKTCAIRKYTGKETDVTVPEKLDGYTVTRIGNQAFARNRKIKSVTLPKRVTKIGKKAFIFCDKLKEVNLSDNIHTIESEAFDECYRLENITLPSKLKKIGSYAFFDCSIKDLYIPQYLEKIGDSSFRNNSLDSIAVDEKNKKFDSREDCNAMIERLTNTIVLGSNKTTVPSTVTAIGEDAFYNCRKLKEITIPAGVKTIGENAFQHCASLEKVIISEGLTDIGEFAFGSCGSLKEVKFPDSLETIGSKAFEYCKSLNSIYIPKNLKKTEDLRDKFWGAGIKSITVADGNPYYDSRDNCNGVIETSSNTLVLACENTNIPKTVKIIGEFAYVTFPSELIIPEGVEELSEGALCGCETTEKITLPSSLKSIGPYAFEHCYLLKEITIPEGITEIKESTFNCCEALEEITLPSSLTVIESCITGSSYKMETVNYRGSIAQWKKIKISDYDILEELYINYNYKG